MAFKIFHKSEKPRKAGTPVSEIKDNSKKEKIMEEKELETQEEVKEETKETETTETEPVEQAPVAEQQPQPLPVVEEKTELGIKVEDLMTKAEFDERLSAFEAKYDAMLKENKDLKDKLTAMTDKYEKNDFGTQSSKGVPTKNADANDTFDNYAKQFM